MWTQQVPALSTYKWHDSFTKNQEQWFTILRPMILITLLHQWSRLWSRMTQDVLIFWNILLVVAVTVILSETLSLTCLRDQSILTWMPGQGRISQLTHSQVPIQRILTICTVSTWTWVWDPTFMNLISDKKDGVMSWLLILPIHLNSRNRSKELFSTKWKEHIKTQIDSFILKSVVGYSWIHLMGMIQEENLNLLLNCHIKKFWICTSIITIPPICHFIITDQTILRATLSSCKNNIWRTTRIRLMNTQKKAKFFWVQCHKKLLREFTTLALRSLQLPMWQLATI